MNRTRKFNFSKMKLLIGFIFYDLRIFHFLNGLAIGLLFYFYSEDVYEDQLFDALASNIRSELPYIRLHSDDSILVRSLGLTHELEQNRMAIFSNAQFRGFKAQYLQPVTFDLMTGHGACGSNAYVLGRLLMEFNYPIRFGQMKVNGIYGGHIILEAKVNDKWIALDPSFNLVFRNAKGNLASFEEIKTNWSFYQKQIPSNYNQAYDYGDIRYTNWGKIPILMPLVKHFLSIFIGEDKTNALSLRVVILRKFQFLFWISLFIYGGFHLVRLYIYRKQVRLWLQRASAQFNSPSQ